MVASVSPQSTSSVPAVSTLMDMNAIRWYILVLPEMHRGKTDLLKAIQTIWAERGLQPFDYLAPQYREMRKVRGKLKVVDRPLLYQYVFVHASVRTILEIKRYRSAFSFLPRVTTDKEVFYPYLTDAAMENLKWVARSYEHVLPVYVPKPNQLVRGDKVRITGGRFAGVTAEVVVSPGKGAKEVMLCLENCFMIPLLDVAEGEYEVIAFNKGSKHHYFQLNDSKLQASLFEAVRQACNDAAVSQAAQQLAKGVIQKYAHTQVDTDIMRIRLYCLLLPAYQLVGQAEAYNDLLAMLVAIEPTVTAFQARALLHLTLYACTDSVVWHRRAHESIAVFAPDSQKKTERFLQEQLKAFDMAYRHNSIV